MRTPPSPRRLCTELIYQPHSLRLHVSDDGTGFDAGQSTHEDGKHCGLLIMQERAEQIGGRLRVTTRPGSGTDLELVVPIATEQVH